jgi:hypothetical protein
MAAARTRRLLSRQRKGQDPLALVMRDEDRRSLYASTAALTAGLLGWFTCAMFASVAYSWTFYYLLALIVATRELARLRLSAARAIEAERTNDSVRSVRFGSQRITGAAWRRGLAKRG